MDFIGLERHPGIKKRACGAENVSSGSLYAGCSVVYVNMIIGLISSTKLTDRSVEVNLGLTLFWLFCLVYCV